MSSGTNVREGTGKRRAGIYTISVERCEIRVVSVSYLVMVTDLYNDRWAVNGIKECDTLFDFGKEVSSSAFVWRYAGDHSMKVSCTDVNFILNLSEMSKFVL